MREKEGILIIAQVDHLSGEELGWAMELLNVKGIRNKNVISTITKKGRPGYIFMLDVDPEQEKVIAELLARNLSIYGYHCINTVHKHMCTKLEEVNITITHQNKSLETKIWVKSGDELEGFLSIESDNLLDLSKEVKEQLGVLITPLELKAKIKPLLVDNYQNGIIITI